MSTNLQMIVKIPEVVRDTVLRYLVAIYGKRDDQIGTAFLTVWKGRQLLVTAMHCLYGANLYEDPWSKQIIVGNELMRLGDVATSTIACDQPLDVAIIHVSGFEKDRVLPFTALQFGAAPSQLLTLVGYLGRDFKRDVEAEILGQVPFCFTNTKFAMPSGFVGISYTNRAITTETGQRELSPIPRGLSGTLMLDSASLLLGKIKVYGVFTDERMHQAHVFGTHIDVLEDLFGKLVDLK